MSAAQVAKTTNAKVEELDVLVVGGGFAGVYQLPNCARILNADGGKTAG